MATAFNPTQQNAMDLLSQTLTSWGLASLIPSLRGFITGGDTSPDTLTLNLENTEAYKQRFAGNAVRKAKGLPELTPAQYIATEEQYRQIMASYGLPKGFYDQKSDYDQLIGSDVSASELDSRAKVAQQTWLNADDETKSVLKSYYGLSDGQAVAAVLNPNTPLSTLQNQAQIVALGAAAGNSGLSITKQRADQLNRGGVTLQQAQQAYQDIASNIAPATNILDRFSTGTGPTQAQTQTTMENAALLGSGSAQAQLRTANQSEENLFAGHSGADATTLASDTSGV